jgi:hypothetical protein
MFSMLEIESIEAANASVSHRWRRSLVLALMGLLIVILSARLLPAQEPLVDREAKIKAAYLYQFIRYVQWPSDAFANTGSPIVIGSVGSDPVNQYLAAIAHSRTAGSRELVYRTVTNVTEARACHIVFVSDGADRVPMESIVRDLGNDPVLLVGENPNFLANGGVISFRVENNKIRLQLSTTAASRHQLKISSQLAKLAQIVN